MVFVLTGAFMNEVGATGAEAKKPLATIIESFGVNVLACFSIFKVKEHMDLDVDPPSRLNRTPEAFASKR